MLQIQNLALYVVVNSVSEFTFEQNKDSTLCTEDVTYECPMIFSKFCEKEVWYQRHIIMENLQAEFSKPSMNHW